MNTQFDLAGKTVIITGASSGLGKALALGLAEDGVRVVICGTNEERLMEVHHSIEDKGGNVHSVICDVRKEQEVQHLVDEAVRVYGEINGVVNNAGFAVRKEVLDFDLQDFEKIVDVNLIGTFLVSRAAARVMIEQKQGSIVNISSLSSIDTFPRLGAYAASKGGVNSLTRVMALEWAKLGVRVNAILPGRFYTPMLDDLLKKPEEVDYMFNRIPMGRIGKPEELQGVVTFLLSEAASYMTGSLIHVDGGWTASA